MIEKLIDESNEKQNSNKLIKKLTVIIGILSIFCNTLYDGPFVVKPVLDIESFEKMVNRLGSDSTSRLGTALTPMMSRELTKLTAVSSVMMPALTAGPHSRTAQNGATKEKAIEVKWMRQHRYSGIPFEGPP